MPKHHQELLTSGESARLLDRSTERVRQLEYEGRLRAAARTARGMRLFRRSDVERLARELRE
jgi:DNA-binding transcriptional MerR regulator